MKKMVFMMILFLLSANMITAAENDKQLHYEEVAALENVNIKLFARKDNGYLRDFQLQVGNNRVEFPEWINVDHPEYYPKLYSVDLTKDGQEEIAVILTTKKGNGLFVNSAHVFEKWNGKQDHIDEIYHENLQAEVQKNTSFTYTDEHVKINLKGKEIVLTKPTLEKNTKLSLGHFVLYKISDQSLKGVLLVEQSNRKYIGSIIATYRYHQGVLVIDDMEFKRH